MSLAPTVGTTAETRPAPVQDTPSTPAGPPLGSVVQAPGGVLTRRAPATPFEVHLDVFDGPFDLLLGLISKHKLDITEIALAQVTDEFVAHIRSMQAADDEWDLSQASEFLVVAATLLDLKAARLLPQLPGEDDEDLALIEARDLLFARLLQYRAYKQIAATFEERMATHGRATPRDVALEPHLAALLPELVMTVTPEQLAMIAARALTPKAPPTVGLTHLHAPAVSVREQARILAARLRERGECAFAELVADAGSTLVVVARFLAVLELFKERVLELDQEQPLASIVVRWTGGDPEDPDAAADAADHTADHAADGEDGEDGDLDGADDGRPGLDHGAPMAGAAGEETP